MVYIFPGIINIGRTIGKFIPVKNISKGSVLFHHGMTKIHKDRNSTSTMI